MRDRVKALRLVLLGEVHPAVVTTVDFDDADGLRLDEVLIAAAGFLEHEKVELYESSTGSRLSLHLRRGKLLYALTKDRNVGELVPPHSNDAASAGDHLWKDSEWHW